MRYLIDLDPGQSFFGFIANWIHGLENLTLSNALTILMWALCIIVPYLLGSLNSAIIISKYKFKQDIRSFGSGNAGLTNMHRVYGKDGAIWTLIGDIVKQLVCVTFGAILFGLDGAYLAGAFCMIGHIFPVFYKFKGGKGVLTAATMILLIDPMIFAVLFTIFCLVLLITRYVSLSSSLSLFELFFPLFVGILIIFMHRSNIFRLFNNQESKFSFRKKPETQEVLDMEDSENDADNSYYPPAVGNKKKKK